MRMPSGSGACCKQCAGRIELHARQYGSCGARADEGARPSPRRARLALPLLSVLLAVHNGERHLREAMDSILAQANENFEFLVIDDGSTDSSRQIVESYDDRRIRLAANDT